MRSSSVPVMTAARLPPLINGSREQLQSTTIALTRLRTHTHTQTRKHIRICMCECVYIHTHIQKYMCELPASAKQANSKFKN